MDDSSRKDLFEAATDNATKGIVINTSINRRKGILKPRSHIFKKVSAEFSV